jgi:phospholipid/cholesterol/gamma-HCH transport system ATP-binding protein
MTEQTTSESPVAVQGLRKSFGSQMVLDGLTFQLVAGQVTCVLGRSGTGKSVLLKLLIGLASPDAGSIRLDGQDMARASPKELHEARKKIGFLFQQAALYDSMTIEENVAFPLRRHTKLSDAACHERAITYLAKWRRTPLLHRLPKLARMINTPWSETRSFAVSKKL